jgi:hypothetical protein
LGIGMTRSRTTRWKVTTYDVPTPMIIPQRLSTNTLLRRSLPTAEESYSVALWKAENEILTESILVRLTRILSSTLREYLVCFDDGTEETYTANLIAESLYSQIDD